MLLALAEAHAHYRSKIVVDSVERREVDTRGCLCGRRRDEVYGRTWRDGSGPLYIQIRFGLTAVETWIYTVQDYVLAREILRQTKKVAKIHDGLNVDIRLADDRDRLSR